MSEWRHYQTDSDEEKIWMTVYADMITNLMLFFLMLYGLSRMSAEARLDIMKGMEQKFRGRTDVEARAERIMKEVREEEAANKVSSIMAKEGLEDQASVEISEKQIKITLNIPVLFAAGDIKLAGQAKQTLAGFAKVLSAVQNKVVIEGHTDNQPVTRGAFLSNWELSVARAYSVIEYFVMDKGIDPARFIAAGYGEYRPVAPNDSPEGRAKNRRIEMVMIRKG